MSVVWLAINLFQFPSPRGVELHKPSWVSPRRARGRCICFRPLARLSCINHWSYLRDVGPFAAFPSPRGVELHKPGRRARGSTAPGSRFPSPREVELHKPPMTCQTATTSRASSFRPLAGLSCINRAHWHLPTLGLASRFRPLAGLSCINLDKFTKGSDLRDIVSVPSRG